MIKEYSYKRDKNVNLSAHFKVKEFKCKDGKTDKILIDSDLIVVLESLFVNLNCKSITITSGYRTPEWSVKVGGYATDNHTKGIACDIKCKNKRGEWIPAKDILCCYELLGYTGGAGKINNYAVHIDTRPNKCFFIEGSKTITKTSWLGFYGRNDAKLFTPVIVVDTDLNIRKGAGRGYSIVNNVPCGTHLAISNASVKGEMFKVGSWGIIYYTPQWCSLSPFMVAKL